MVVFALLLPFCSSFSPSSSSSSFFFLPAASSFLFFNFLLLLLPLLLLLLPSFFLLLLLLLLLLPLPLPVPLPLLLLLLLLLLPFSSFFSFTGGAELQAVLEAEPPFCKSYRILSLQRALLRRTLGGAGGRLVKSMDLAEKIKKSRNFGAFEANFG